MDVVSPQDIMIDVNQTAHGLVKLDQEKNQDKVMLIWNWISDYNAASKCKGGPSTTCLTQVPFVLDGSPAVGYAFGAIPLLVQKYVEDAS